MWKEGVFIPKTMIGMLVKTMLYMACIHLSYRFWHDQRLNAANQNCKGCMTSLRGGLESFVVREWKRADSCEMNGRILKPGS